MLCLFLFSCDELNVIEVLGKSDYRHICITSLIPYLSCQQELLMLDCVFSVSVTLRYNQHDILLPAGKAICCIFFFFFLFQSRLDLTVVQLNTVAFMGTISDRCDQEICSVLGFPFIHKQNKVINLGKCYCNTEFIVFNLMQLLSACLQSRYVDQMQYFCCHPCIICPVFQSKSAS